jgi:hypothetical protein
MFGSRYLQSWTVEDNLFFSLAFYYPVSPTLGLVLGEADQPPVFGSESLTVADVQYLNDRIPPDKFLSLGGRSEEISQIWVVWGKAIALSRANHRNADHTCGPRKRAFQRMTLGPSSFDKLAAKRHVRSPRIRPHRASFRRVRRTRPRSRKWPVPSADLRNPRKSGPNLHAGLLALAAAVARPIGFTRPVQSRVEIVPVARRYRVRIGALSFGRAVFSVPDCHKHNGACRFSMNRTMASAVNSDDFGFVVRARFSIFISSVPNSPSTNS